MHLGGYHLDLRRILFPWGTAVLVGLVLGALASVLLISVANRVSASQPLNKPLGFWSVSAATIAAYPVAAGLFITLVSALLLF